MSHGRRPLALAAGWALSSSGGKDFLEPIGVRRMKPRSVLRREELRELVHIDFVAEKQAGQFAERFV